MDLFPKTIYYKFNKVFLAFLIFALVCEFMVINTPIYAEQIMLDSLINCTNEIRREHYHEPLFLNYDLNRAAYEKLQDMDRYDYWAHDNPQNNKEPWFFFNEVGYEYVAAGENLAFNFFNSEDVCKTWQNSPSHFANIVDSNYQEVGFAIDHVDLGAYGTGILVVQMFGSREDFVPPTDERAFYNLECDQKIDPNTRIINPGCEAINETNPEIKIYNPTEVDLDVTLDDTNLAEYSSVDEAYLVATNPEPLVQGKHTIRATDKGSPFKSAQLEFIVDTIVPMIHQENLQIEFREYDGLYSDYRITLDIEEYYSKFFEKISLTVYNPKEDKVFVEDRLFQKVSNDEYVIEFKIEDAMISKNLMAKVTILDSVGHEVIVEKPFPKAELNSSILMARTTKLPLSMLKWVRGIVVALALLFVGYAFMLYKKDRKKFIKLHTRNYSFILEVGFLSLLMLSTYLFL